MIHRWRRLALLALLCCAAPAQAAIRFHLDPDGLTPAEVAASTQLTEVALGHLPANWRRTQVPEVELQWRNDLPAHVSGRALGHRIRLDRRILAQWMAVAGDADTLDGRRALATLLHELAHVLDRSPQGGWSRQSRFRELAGWQARPLRIGRGRNRFADRSPDRYELHSPAEFFAVNAEYYLLDREYACRRPALHAWFAARLGPATLPPPDCGTTMPLLQNTGAEGGAALMTLDPARIYEVDYLLAEGNHQPMSRWGHSMLRLVICAPGRAPGPACRLDLPHHRVLSFRAFVSDVQISSWRGLTGGYPSRLFVLPLDQVIDEYTKVELRGLQSIPLRLSRDDIAELLQRTGQVHWGYDGRYFFVSNNCAVETGKLLQEGISRLESSGLDRITPRGLLRRLQRQGIADASVLDDRETALRQGYYFESAAAHYQNMLDVARAALPIPQRTVAQWWAQPAQARGKWIADADLRAAAALLLLEQGALRRQELQVRDALKRRLLGSDKALEQSRETLEQLLEVAGVLARPAALAGERGYGLPRAAELATLEHNAGQLSARARQGAGQLREQGRARLSVRQQQALAGTEANLDQLAQRLRILSRETPSSPTP
ncbi:DUF4105 domain-containing protein [Stenotrophomonas sp. YIM B06876]|uniref:DUF7844 domain-containing protein n=1 Tax=Stenotrophomonas sp. YIM B06876 TaxID=3060211 RepID=UPI002738523A|nr:DUF4105 domain-containing protein [Stenotrophomonas sp. YIM B06876]